MRETTSHRPAYIVDVAVVSEYPPPGPPSPQQTPSTEPAGSSTLGIGTDLRNILIVMAIAAFIIFIVVRQCSTPAVPPKEMPCQTLPPATIGLPPDWRILPHSQGIADEPDDTIEQALSNLIITPVEPFKPFNGSDAVRQNKSFDVEATMRTYLRKREVRLKSTEHLTISDYVEATLLGDSSFQVSPSGPQAQKISNCKPTTWIWRVTPQIPKNDQVLKLRFDAIITINDEQTKRIVKAVFESHLDVAPEQREPSSGLDWIRKMSDWIRKILPL